MKNYFRRYLILAIMGALIIGLAFYLFFNNYLDRERIIVAAQDIKAGAKLTTEDLTYMEFYKDSLPEEYSSSMDELIGNTMGIERRKGDHISLDMFDSEIKDNNIFSSLEDGGVIIAIEIQHPEPILEKLNNGDIVTIVSTTKDKDLLQESYKSEIINNEIEDASDLSGSEL